LVNKPYLALIDADTWSYDVAFAAERKDEDGEAFTLPFSYCMDLIDFRLEGVLEAVGCKEYAMYLTGRDNFRHDIATILPYKGNRKQPKPWHYENIRQYLTFTYKAQVVDGMEADDILSIQQTEMGTDSVIVSRDKDLRTVEGWHYGYPLSIQPEKPLEYITEMGYLTLSKKRKLSGGGMRLFYAQCIMGDKVDNIQGLPRHGDVKAYNILEECENETELYEKTLETYQNYYDDEEKARQALHENASLLWMTRELDEDGRPVLWKPPK